MLLGDNEGRSVSGSLEEVRLIAVSLGGVIYCMLALLLILIFHFYMILCSCQIIYLNDYLVVRLSFDRRASILHIGTYICARSNGCLGT